MLYDYVTLNMKNLKHKNNTSDVFNDNKIINEED